MNTPGRAATALALAGVALLAGMAVQMQRAQVVPAGTAGALLIGAVGVAALALLLRRHHPRASLLSLALAAAAIGHASTDLRAAARLAHALSPALEGQDLQVTGVVVSLPQQGPNGLRFVFDIEQARHRGAPVVVPRRVRLAWFAGIDADGLLGAADEPLRAGQRWRLTVRLRQPHGALNPHGFDLELWLFEHGLRATGYVRSLSAQANRLLAEDAVAPVERLRQGIRDAIYRTVTPPAAAGVLAALAIGDQSAIEREDWELYRRSGIAHLMSISGLHVTMFAWLAAALIGCLWRRSSRLVLRMPAPLAAHWGGLAAAAAYALLAGWGVPAQRTVWMLATVVLLRSSGLRWPAPAVLLGAAVVVCGLDPWALLQPGFWLSFVAVGLLMGSQTAPLVRDAAAAAPARRWGRRLGSLRSGLAGMLRTQAVASVGLAPLSLLFFGQVSLVGFAANLIAIPLVTLLVTPLALLGLLLPPLWHLAAGVVQALNALLGVMVQVPWATWTAAAAPTWAAAAGLLGGLVLVLPLPWRWRLLGVPLLLPLLHPALSRPPEGRFEAVVMDIGQGTAVLVRTRTHLLVYDSGPRWSPEADAGQRLVVPLLRARGERQIDLLMLSHRDSDHVGGAASLLREVPVRRIASSLEEAHPLRALALPHEPCLAGQRWQWDGVRFELLHPRPEDLVPGIRPNFISCVLRIEDAAGGSLLLTGDIESAQEAALVQRGLQASDVVLVPHHGSRTSSSAAFIEASAPKTAVVQAAYRSRFGHPAPDVVQRYLDRGITLVRTDRCGAWLQHAAGTQECQRSALARYWHHRPQ